MDYVDIVIVRHGSPCDGYEYYNVYEAPGSVISIGDIVINDKGEEGTVTNILFTGRNSETYRFIVACLGDPSLKRLKCKVAYTEFEYMEDHAS